MTTRISNESGMTLMAVMVFLTIFAFVLMAAAPSVSIDIQREKELESIRRGEEIAEAIHLYMLYHSGRKLPTSLDELLEGLPDGTKKRQILRPSAIKDPLSLDGRWRLVGPEPDVLARFAKRVQAYNNGMLPTSQPPNIYNRYVSVLANVLNTETEAEMEEAEAEDTDLVTEGPFIGVASQSRAKSVVTYYGIENHSKWLFTPLFRGTEPMRFVPGPRPPNP